MSSEPNPLHDIGPPDTKDRKFVVALARGLELLRVFKPGDVLLGNQEIAERTGLPKPTVTRLTYTLTRLGYLAYSKRFEKYRLGTGVLALGYVCLSNYGVREVARPLMRELAEETRASVSLGARERLYMTYLENCSGHGALTLRLNIGSRVPMATTAMGRALLAALPEDERGYLLDHIRRRDEAAWPEVHAGIKQALNDYRERGYCISAGDWDRDVNAVGVPIILPDSAEVLAFNCGGPSFLLPRDKLHSEIGPRLRHLVSNVETALSRY